MDRKIEWRALMQTGVCVLGLKPDEFWALTPAEFIFLATDGRSAQTPMNRKALAMLMTRFPDRPEKEA